MDRYDKHTSASTQEKCSRSAYEYCIEHAVVALPMLEKIVPGHHRHVTLPFPFNELHIHREGGYSVLPVYRITRTLGGYTFLPMHWITHTQGGYSVLSVYRITHTLSFLCIELHIGSLDCPSCIHYIIICTRGGYAVFPVY